MKKFITILMSCSLALAATAIAQQDGEQSPAPKKQQGKAHAAPPQAKPEAERPAAKPHAGRKAKEQNAADANADTQAPAREPAAANPKANAQAGRHNRKGQNAAKAPATATQAETQAAAAPQANQPKAETAPAAAQANQANARPNRLNGQPAKKPDVKVVEKIKQEHVNFHAQPKPALVPTVTFSQTRRIEGADHWQGERYAVFRSYHPQMHDERYYHSRYSRVELIGGGYYYFNAGYWYPAWGYNSAQQYYAYDGPIYAGARAEPPDRVIADVQAVLQQQGYYTGEVDGLLGPLTRQALTGYQTDNGLYTTATIDQPTLDSLGMG